MSAIDPLKRALARRLRFRSVDARDARAAGAASGHAIARVTSTRCTYRAPDADFYCWKYGLWYNLMDCCYRHARRTFPGCAACGQGASNLKQNRMRYHALRERRCSPFAR